MQAVKGWRIWYDDETTFSSEDGSPEDAPVDGVLIIIEYFDDGTKRITQGMDYLYWNGEGWQGGNQADLDRWLRRDFPRVKLGRWTTDTIYRQVESEAMSSDCEGC